MACFLFQLEDEDVRFETAAESVAVRARAIATTAAVEVTAPAAG